ncbi:LamG-like jellyroll fold domain-containing protein [Flavobacterium lacustre]|uniref:LamG-like jellyroll fold domain-containing protein n=1 Tax=Flavobacterium lacustre TaxID=3016339 RepID=UPI0022B7384B|nr:LamG-like jellyroll fold domain-containing protein [Flavobacterium lacustre]
MKKIITILLLIGLIYSCSTNTDSNGNSTTSVVPVAPSNLTVTLASTTQINLSWTDNSTNETGFKIERKTGIGTYAVVGSSVTDITTYNDTSISPGTTYTYRVYSNNSVGNSLTYSNEFTITTTSIINLPKLTSTALSLITSSTAVSGGVISNDGGALITARGVCWSTNTNPTISLSTKTTDGTGAGLFTSNIKELTANTTFYVRAYATNSAGTAYGNELTLLTQIPDIISGLVAYYPFTGNSNDISGNANNGIVTNATLTNDRFGNSNKAYSFNGSSSYITVPNSSSLSASTYQLTISAWVKINQFTGSPNKAASIIDKSASTSGDWGLFYQDFDANTLVENIRYGGYLRYNNTILSQGLHTSSVASSNHWVHLVLTVDGNLGTNYYINGINESAVGSGGNNFSLWPNSANMFIGKSGTVSGNYYNFLGSNYNYFNGVIDDVRIYNRALNSNEVNYLFNQN